MIWLHELGQIFQRWRNTKKNRVKTPGEGLFGKIFTEIELKWVFNIQEIFDLMDFLHIVWSNIGEDGTRVMEMVMTGYMDGV